MVFFSAWLLQHNEQRKAVLGIFSMIVAGVIGITAWGLGGTIVGLLVVLFVFALIVSFPRLYNAVSGGIIGALFGGGASLLLLAALRRFTVEYIIVGILSVALLGTVIGLIVGGND